MTTEIPEQFLRADAADYESRTFSDREFAPDRPPARPQNIYLLAELRRHQEQVAALKERLDDAEHAHHGVAAESGRRPLASDASSTEMQSDKAAAR